MKCPVCGTRNNYYYEKCVKCGFILNVGETEEDFFESYEKPILLPDKRVRIKPKKRKRIWRKAQ